MVLELSLMMPCGTTIVDVGGLAQVVLSRCGGTWECDGADGGRGRNKVLSVCAIYEWI